MIEIRSEEDLQVALRENQIVIVQFGADTCAPCAALKNRIAQWNRDHPAVKHLYVQTVQQPQLCAQLGIFTVPAVSVYVEGKLTARSSGYFSLDELLSQTEKYEQMLGGEAGS